MAKRKLNTKQQAIVAALQQGYTYDAATGTIQGKYGEPMKLRCVDPDSYPTLNVYVQGVTNPAGKPTRLVTVAAHKLAAYALFGEASFKRGVQVRHMNGKHDIRGESLKLGTATVNAYDKPPEVRRAMAKKARAAQGSTWNRKFNDEQAVTIRELVRERGDAGRLARLLDVDVSTIHKIARGARYPPPQENVTPQATVRA